MGIAIPDAIGFFQAGTHVLLTEQSVDQAAIIEVDQETGVIGRRVATLANPSARLSFPHGAGFSPDGDYFAVTSYGEDQFSIFAAADAA